MRLLITRFGDPEITLVDTEKEIVKEFPVFQFNPTCTVSVTGLAYSGNWLCIGVNGDSKGYLYLFNFICHEEKIHLLDASMIGDIVSVFPGHIYFNTKDSIVSVDFTEESGELTNEMVHYKLPTYQKYLKSICSYQMRWYGGIKNAVIELSNPRTVYSALNSPVCLFFNSFNRLSFIDPPYTFCAGDDLFYLPDETHSVIEDTGKAGYWVHSGAWLNFLSYNGVLQEFIEIGPEPSVKMVEARGRIHEYFTQD